LFPKILSEHRPHPHRIPAVILSAIIISGTVILSSAAAQNKPASGAPDSVFQLGEELTYNVSYASIDIGRVRIRLEDTVRRNGQLFYRAAAYIDSYKGIPFVNLHAVYENNIAPDGYSTWFRARDKDDERWVSTEYIFDYPGRSIRVEIGDWKSGKIDSRDTIKVDTLYQDGLSMFYFARKNLFCGRKVKIPAVVREKKGNAFIDFKGQRCKEEVEAIKYPLDLVHFEGQAGFVGIFGLTGDFEGWFTNDAARVPVIANMKVILGNIRIELESWKRAGWIPPRYSGENGK